MSLCLLLGGYIFTRGLNKHLDIWLYDETFHLMAGVRFFQDGSPPVDQGVLYSLWYAFLHFFQTDTVALYDLNVRLISISLPILIFIFLRTFQVQRIISLAFSAFFLISCANLPLAPKSVHFALIILLVSLILARNFRNRSIKWQTLAAGALISSFARPEWSLVSFLFLILAFISAISSGKRTVVIYSTLFWASLLPAVILIIGNPFSGDSERAWIAFGQHFAANWCRWYPCNVSPWSDHAPMIKEAFGTAGNIREAFFANPALFFKHFLYNLIDFPKNLARLGLFYPVFLPQKPISWVLGPVLIALVSFCTIVWKIRSVCLIKRRHVISHLVFAGYSRIFSFFLDSQKKRSTDSAPGELFRASCVYSLVILLAAGLIAPRTHYLLVPALLWISVLLSFLFPEHEEPEDLWWLRIMLGVQLLLLPDISKFEHTPMGSCGINPPNRIRIERFRNESFKRPVPDQYRIYVYPPD